jgi:hypothetical protein
MSSPQLEMAVGLKKGHKVTKNAMKPKPSRRKGVSNKLVMAIYMEAGLARLSYGDSPVSEILPCSN